MTLSKQQHELIAEARDLAVKVFRQRAADIDREEAYPWDNIEQLTKHRFMGMTIPKEYGGRGLTYLDALLVVEEVAKECATTARIVVEANMGAVGAIMRYGDDSVKQRVAELVLNGDKPAICITEPGAGSDVQAIETIAKAVDGGYEINGHKHWITGGGVSKVHLIFAHVVENGEKQGIEAFLAIRDPECSGLEIGKREPTMGLRGIPERHLHFKNLRVAKEAKLDIPGTSKGALPALLNAYNSQRTGAATVAMGIACGANNLALEYAKQRKQFGKRLNEFQGLQWMLADMDVKLDVSRSLIHKAVVSGDDFPDKLLTARAKLYAAEAAIEITNNALQIFGARGYSRNLPLERMVRDARMFAIGGGTAQILRNLIGAEAIKKKDETGLTAFFLK